MAANGWMGLGSVCYGQPLEAAQASCAATVNCQGIVQDAPPVDTDTGAKAFQTVTATGSPMLFVQPCTRLDTTFFDALLPAVIPAIVLILCLKAIQRQFNTHA